MTIRIHENKLKKDLYKENNTAAKNLRFLRMVNGYKQRELAEHLGVCRSVYHSIENFSKQPDYDTLAFFADFYGIDINYLVTCDICDQIMTMIQVDQERVSAAAFLERYYALSQCGRDQIRDEIFGLAEHEKQFNRFPWKYEGYEDLVTVDTLYEKKLLYEERERKNRKK